MSDRQRMRETKKYWMEWNRTQYLTRKYSRQYDRERCEDESTEIHVYTPISSETNRKNRHIETDRQWTKR